MTFDKTFEMALLANPWQRSTRVILDYVDSVIFPESLIRGLKVISYRWMHAYGAALCLRLSMPKHHR